MYGLLLESFLEVVQDKYGEEMAEKIRRQANVPQHTFVTHKVYSETLIPRMVSAIVDLTGDKVEEIMDLMGSSFVTFVTRYGYDKLLRVLGRNFRDFLNGLDNLHEYLRFSYPKLKPPSFFVDNETADGLTLHYRSKRKGFIHYVKGQIRMVAKIFYNMNVDVQVISESRTEAMTHVIMKLYFDNSAYDDVLKDDHPSTNEFIPSTQLNVSSQMFFSAFPFHMVFTRALVISSTGTGLQAILPDLCGKQVDIEFALSRPLLELSWSNIMSHTNNIFELTTTDPIILRGRDESTFEEDFDSVSRTTSMSGGFELEAQKHLKLKGQMMYMKEWNAMMFLGTPVMPNLDTMFNTGLYINDLSMHDSSRDLVLAGTQQSVELKLALDQEQQKSKKLEDSMRKLDIEMRKTDLLLYQMIPKAIADRLRRGEKSLNICETFESVTILFSDVVGFTSICSLITPMQVVAMLNSMYTVFDRLSERHNVYKVETIGDAYMVVSGAPSRSKLHAHHICELAIDMLHSMKKIPDPSNREDHLRIRIGTHSGMVVAGVVGLKMPRYCLFGDTVNTASRMESNGEEMKIHISQTTKELIENGSYMVEQRGTISVKGKGEMKTYWLTGKDPSGNTDFETAMKKENNILVPKSGKDDSISLLDYEPVIDKDLKKIS